MIDRIVPVYVENQNWTVETYLTECGLSWKPDMTTSIGMVYAKNDIELLWPIESGAVYDDN